MNITSNKQLKLTLHKKAFDVMITGEKTDEYREATKWIKSRLMDKCGNSKYYDTIKFTNGYGSTRPYYVCMFKGWDYCANIHRRYSNGLEVDLKFGIEIQCGKILEKGNL